MENKNPTTDPEIAEISSAPLAENVPASAEPQTSEPSSEPQAPPQKGRKKAWLLAMFGLFFVGIVVTVSFWAGSEYYKMKDIDGGKTKIEDTADGEADEVSVEVEEEDLDEDADLGEDIDEVTLVYTLGSELRLLNPDGTSTLLETLENPYNPGEEIVAAVSYPQFSPDGTRILYASGLNLKVYNLATSTADVIYTADSVSPGSGTFANVIHRYTWKSDSEIIFEHEMRTDSTAGGWMKETVTLKHMDLDTDVITDWGTYDMSTGFGGMSDDPADWMLWYFRDLVGLSSRIYYSFGYVYAYTYLQTGSSWIRLQQGGAYSTVTATDFATLTGIEDFSVNVTSIGDYESDASIQSYVLEAMGSAPARFNYSHVQITQSGVAIYDEDVHFAGGLLLGSDGDYLYFTEIENSTELADAIDAEVPAATITDYYPQSFIKRIALATGDVELVTEGLGFDLL